MVSFPGDKSYLPGSGLLLGMRGPSAAACHPSPCPAARMPQCLPILTGSSNCANLAPPLPFPLPARHVPPGQPRRAARGRPGREEGHADALRPQGAQPAGRVQTATAYSSGHTRARGQVQGWKEPPPCVQLHASKSTHCAHLASFCCCRSCPTQTPCTALRRSGGPLPAWAATTCEAAGSSGDGCTGSAGCGCGCGRRWGPGSWPALQQPARCGSAAISRCNSAHSMQVEGAARKEGGQQQQSQEGQEGMRGPRAEECWRSPGRSALVPLCAIAAVLSDLQLMNVLTTRATSFQLYTGHLGCLRLPSS